LLDFWSLCGRTLLSLAARRGRGGARLCPDYAHGAGVTGSDDAGA
jgi:hypothetical protein